MSIQTLISIPAWKYLHNGITKLIESIKDTADRDFHLFIPISDSSQSFNANLSIDVAKRLDCKYLLLMDGDCWWEQENWLSSLEDIMDNSNEYGLLLQGDKHDLNCNNILYADESNNTPYTSLGYCFYRLSNNILWDTDFLFNQSSDVDWIREHRRQGIKTGVYYKVNCRHERAHYDDESRGGPYQKWKLRNERLFFMKWNTICHQQEIDHNHRNKWRGIYGCKDIDNLESYSHQYKSIKPYFESTLFENDKQYIKRMGIKSVGFGDDGYYKLDEQLPENMPKRIFMELLGLNH